jgi:transposase-like protein
MVAAVRQGQSLRSVARQFGVSLRTVQVWFARAQGQRLDRTDWSDRPRGGRRAGRATATRTEDLIPQLRTELKESSALGEYGAAAIHRELRRRQVQPLPSVRTVGRILARRGALGGRRRARRPAPPKGWYLPRLAAAEAELDSFDLVEGLVIRGGTEVMVLNGISLHGGLCASWVGSAWTAKAAVGALVGHWREHGLPG